MAGCDMFRNWETYPLGVDVYTPIGKEHTVCSRDLSTESGRLFQMVGGGVEMVWQEEGSESVKERHVLSEEIEQSGVQKVSAVANWR